MLSKKFSKDRGWLLENLVFISLSKENEVFYYANPNECDFVVSKNRKVTHAIQVCYDLNEGNREREISGLMNALKEFKLKEGLILTNNQEEEIKMSGRKIKILPVWKWLLE